MANTSKQLVWYVSFGSNLNRQRFLVYIRGGRARGGKQIQPGCADRTLPREDRPLEIRYSLYFSGHSFVYDGAVAFVRHEHGSTTKARAYLVTEEQFWQITTQENNWRATPALPSLEQIRADGAATLPDMGGQLLAVPAHTLLRHVERLPRADVHDHKPSR